MGMLEKPLAAPKVFSYGKEGIRKELLLRTEQVKQYSTAKGKPKDGMIVIIKPSKKSTYRNLVDVLDEMAIVGVNKNGSYAIVNEFTPEEVKLLEGK
jgi:biopolymer transport protein ExbD